MDQVNSKDGTAIAITRGGAGPPLLLVHGLASDSETTWKYVTPTFERYFTVLAMDRRGHGASGDSEVNATEPELDDEPDENDSMGEVVRSDNASTYAVEREFDDIAAVIDSMEEPVSVVGHGFGALCAMEACLLTRNVRRLVLYEGSITRSREGVYPDGVFERMKQYLANGDRDAVLTAFFHDIRGVPLDDVSLMRAQPTWIGRLANAHTLPRELQGDSRYAFNPARFASCTMPTLLLVGSESPQAEHQDAQKLAAALPAAEVAVLDGQERMAMHTAPDLFLRIVGDFVMD